MTKAIKSMAMLAIAGLAVLCSCNQEQATEVTLQVKTQHGILEGFEQDGVKKFLGVPFAQAPVGELRWKAPQPAKPWKGVLKAEDVAAFCKDRISWFKIPKYVHFLDVFPMTASQKIQKYKLRELAHELWPEA